MLDQIKERLSEQTELQTAYLAWASTSFDESPNARDEAWHKYCDIRDGMPEGTSKNRKIITVERMYGVLR
jgi:hypothetical protein